MKKYLLGLLLWGQSILYAQDFVKLEYFVDKDPGLGMGSVITLPNGSSSDFTVDLHTVPDGFHYLYVRAQDTGKRWSQTINQAFLKQTFDVKDTASIKTAEYFIDYDKGFGQGNHVAISKNSGTFVVNLKGMSNGLHCLHVRTCDARGSWSQSLHQMFYKHSFDVENTATIDSVEYFIDHDPGIGMATSLSVADGNVSFAVDLSHISPGFHTLYTRARDNRGAWSHTTNTMFFKQHLDKNDIDSLAHVEYFFDTDPGFGKALQPIMTNNSMLITKELGSLVDGIHTLYVRARDRRGAWSHTTSSLFIKLGTQLNDSTKVVSAEYFIDKDPGQGQGISANLSGDSALLLVDISKVTVGSHMLYVRSVDSRGHWSMTLSQFFYKTTIGLSAPTKALAMEYFIDKDPGIGKGIKAMISNDSATIVADLTGIKRGLYILFVRSLDDRGRWSHTVTYPFIKETLKQDEKNDIVSVEYFVDKDPGFGKASPIDIVQPSSSVSQSFVAQLNGLSIGVHSIRVRAKDSYGRWSMLQDTSFCYGPVADFSVSDSIVCNSGIVRFTDMSTRTNKSTVYKWDFDGNGSVDNTTNTSSVKYFDSPGTYIASLTVMAAPGMCPSTARKKIVVSQPSVSIKPKQPGDIYVNATIPLEAHTSNVSPASTIAWTSSGGSFTDNDSVSTKFMAREPGTYVVSATVLDFAKCYSVARDTIKVLPLVANFITRESMDGFLSKTMTIETQYLSRDNSVTWESSNPAVATVNSLGQITCISKGITQIKGIVDGTYPDIISVTVKDYVPLTNVIVPENLGITIGDELKVYASIIPANASIPRLRWFSSDTMVAVVDMDGVIHGVSTGTCAILVRSDDGNIPYTVNVTVNKDIVLVEKLKVPDTIYVKAGDSLLMKAEIIPFNATHRNLSWISTNQSIVEVASNGQIYGIAKGSASIIVVPQEGDEANTVVIVTSSRPPSITLPSSLTFLQEDKQYSIDLSNFVTDDKTPRSNISWKISQPVGLVATIENNILTISQDSTLWTGIQRLTLTAIDGDGLKTQKTIELVVKNIQNTAPIIFLPDISITSATRTAFNLQDYVEDDIDTYGQLTIQGSAVGQTRVSIVGDSLVIIPVSTTWAGSDTIKIVATDSRGLSTFKSIKYSVKTTTRNTPPTIANIPVQFSNSLGEFNQVFLNRYVVDSTTLPANISWTFSGSYRLYVNIEHNVVSVRSIDQNWTGSEKITFYAFDEQGASDSVIVIFAQQSTSRDIQWEGKPKINFFADKNLVTTGVDVQLFSQLTGAQSWRWTIHGPDTIESQDINPRISFEKSGSYSVVLLAMNQQHVDTLIRQDFLRVIGLKFKDTTICPGQSITLGIHAPGVDSLRWNTGEKSPNIIVKPTTTRSFSVTVWIGLFHYNLSATVRVTSPVRCNADTSVCSGDSAIVFASPGFKTYIWNNGKKTRQFLTTQGGIFIVTVTDHYQCTSSDTVHVSTLPLPSVDLGKDKRVCLGTNVELSAPESLQYKWSTGETNRTISIVHSGTISLTVTNAATCHNSDTVKVEILTPFTEQLCVATASENGKNIILAWEHTTGVRTKYYNLYREGISGFKKIASIPYDSAGMYVDTAVMINTTQYTYALSTVDSCLNESPRSTPHTTMHVQPFEDANGNFALQWNSYEGKSIIGYRIEGGDSYKTFQPIEDVPRQNTTYTVNGSNMKQSYRVLALFPDTCYPKSYKSDSGPYSLSLSNIAESKLSRISPDNELISSVVVSPNPAAMVCHVKVVLKSEGQITIDILSLKGQVIKTVTPPRSKTYVVPINLDGIPAGIYEIQVTRNNSQVIKQLIIE